MDRVAFGRSQTLERIEKEKRRVAYGQNQRILTEDQKEIMKCPKERKLVVLRQTSLIMCHNSVLTAGVSAAYPEKICIKY